MKYSMTDIKSSLSHKKRFEDSLFSIVVHRPLSYPITYVFANAGVSAWTTSVLSLFVALIGCGLIGIDSYYSRWIGIALINLWAVLDCVDGNIARVTKTQSEKGSFMDAESGYMICAFVYLSFGMAAYNTRSCVMEIPKHLFIVLGAIASICDILARLVHQKYSTTVHMNPKGITSDEKSSFDRLRKRISTEFGVTGLVLIGAIVAQVLNSYDIIVCFYALFNMLMLSGTIVIYSMKAKK